MQYLELLKSEAKSRMVNARSWRERNGELLFIGYFSLQRYEEFCGWMVARAVQNSEGT